MLAPDRRPRTTASRLLRWTALAALVAAAVAVVVTMPPRAILIEPAEWDARLPGSVARGAYHVHTSRSDGTGSLDQVAAAAARAGLDFVIVTDHGDASEAPLPPSVRSGVLCIDGVELNTTGGHYVAIGLGRAPYRLAGAARDVVEDVARLGGIGIAAHPDSANRALRWADWSLPIEGFEWLSADSEWRDESRRALVWSALHYLWRAPQTIASLLDRPEQTLARWDGMRRRLVALAAVDAHARLGPRGYGDEPDADAGRWGEGFAVPVPSYETAFRTLTTRVELDKPLAGDPAVAAGQLLAAIHQGRVFTVIDALAGPAEFEFSALRPDGTFVRMGDHVTTTNGPLEFLVRAAAPPSSQLVLKRSGTVVAENTGTELRVRDDAAPAGFMSYRAEVYVPNASGTPPVPWILSNPIYVGAAPVAEPTGTPASGPTRWLYGDEDGAEWRAEHDADSVAAVSTVPGVTGRLLVFRFGLASGKEAFWAALARDLEPPLGDARRIRFTARANQPIRVSVQVRSSSAHPEGLRWRRSVYLDETERELTIELDDMAPVGRGTPPEIPPSVDAVLFVVDGTHTKPGSTGIVWFDAIRLER